MSFSDYAIYTVELPVSKHGTPEVKEAKMTEVNNLMDYDVFEEVKDEGQETIGSRWVVTEKEKHDGQKQQTKARLVARLSRYVIYKIDKIRHNIFKFL